MLDLYNNINSSPSSFPDNSFTSELPPSPNNPTMPSQYLFQTTQPSYTVDQTFPISTAPILISEPSLIDQYFSDDAELMKKL